MGFTRLGIGCGILRDWSDLNAMADQKPLQQPGAFALQQQQPVAQPQSVAKSVVTPHSYLALSICVAIFCGFCNPLTLSCTVPAIIVSAMVSADTKIRMEYC